MPRRSARTGSSPGRTRGPDDLRGRAALPPGPGDTFARVYALAAQIPRGRVATYGQLAAVLGTTPRSVGFAMAAAKDPDLPWHRVLNASGRSSLGGRRGAEQRACLRREGVRFDRFGRVDLERWGWLPLSVAAS